MFIERKLEKMFPAPAERNVIAPETLRSAGARVPGQRLAINIRLLRSREIVWLRLRRAVEICGKLLSFGRASIGPATVAAMNGARFGNPSAGHTT